jgi:hypothetical protein
MAGRTLNPKFVVPSVEPNGYCICAVAFCPLSVDDGQVRSAPITRHRFEGRGSVQLRFAFRKSWWASAARRSALLSVFGSLYQLRIVPILVRKNERIPVFNNRCGF